MKATEFVAALEALIAEHGDLEVLCCSHWHEDQAETAALCLSDVDGDKSIAVLADY